jgi:prevent-host-death family protein
MGEPIDMYEAESDLSRLVERALAGEDVVIARAGKPVVRLVPVAVPDKRNLGIWRGKVRMAEDFDAPMTEQELADWGGR